MPETGQVKEVDTDVSKNEKRLRDLVGGLSAKLEKQDAKIAALEAQQTGGQESDLTDDQMMALLQAMGQSQGQSSSSSAPVPAVPQTPEPQMVQFFNPTTGTWMWGVPQNAGALAPAPAPQVPGAPQASVPPLAVAPVPNQPRQTLLQTQPQPRDPLVAMWSREYDRLADDLEFYGKIHPREADRLAGEIIQEALKGSAQVNTVLRAHVKESPAVLEVIRQRVSADLELVGPKVDPNAATTSKPSATNIEGTAGVVRLQSDIEKPDEGVKPEGEVKPETPPAASAAAPTSSTSAPPTVTGKQDLVQQGEAAKLHIDEALIG